MNVVSKLRMENAGAVTLSEGEPKNAVTPFNVWLKGVFCISARTGEPVSKSNVADGGAETGITGTWLATTTTAVTTISKAAPASNSRLLKKRLRVLSDIAFDFSDVILMHSFPD